MKSSFTIALISLIVLFFAACDLNADSTSENVIVVNDGTDTVYFSSMTLQRSYLVDPIPEMLRATTQLPFIGPGYWSVLAPISAYKQELGIAVFVYRPAIRNDSSLIILDTLIQKPYSELQQSNYVRIP